MWQILKSVADPDLQIREGREGDGHPDPEIRGGGGLKKNFLGPFRASVSSKNEGGPPLDPSLKMVDELNPLQNPTQHSDTSRVVQKAQLDQNQYLWSARPVNSQAQRI